MADRQSFAPLPADLPEDWNAGQTIAPTGEEVGLSRQHGYNYLMEMVNKAQRGVNLAHETLETVGGKRSCRFTVGTTASGWTAADCDYLCDGVDDQVEINQAFSALPGGGGEVVLLDGTYMLNGMILVKQNCVLQGNGASTVLVRGTDGGSFLDQEKNALVVLASGAALQDIAVSSTAEAVDVAQISCNSGGNRLSNILFSSNSKHCGIGIYIRVSNGLPRATEIESCTFSNLTAAICLGRLADNTIIRACKAIYDVEHFVLSYSNLDDVSISHIDCEIIGNVAEDSDIQMFTGERNIIASNILKSIEIIHIGLSSGAKVCGSLIANNVFRGDLDVSHFPAITLGANTYGWFVVGNQLRVSSRGVEGHWDIVDNGEMNDVRFNSNDAGGSSGGGGATVYGIPSGGSSGQILAKRSGTNYDAGWIDPPSGGSSGGVTMEEVNAVIQNAITGAIEEEY